MKNRTKKMKSFLTILGWLLGVMLLLAACSGPVTTPTQPSETVPETAQPQRYELRLVVDSFNEESDWKGSGSVTYIDTASPTATKFAMVAGSLNNSLYKQMEEALDMSPFRENGVLHLWLYVANEADVGSSQIELSSSGQTDQQEGHWKSGKDYSLKSGWNELELPFASLEYEGGEPDLLHINYIRVYVNAKNKCDIAVDDMYCRCEGTQPVTEVVFRRGDNEIRRQFFLGSTIRLEDYHLTRVGFDPTDWNDGAKALSLEDSYTIDKDGIVLVEEYQEWTRYAVKYTDGAQTVDGESMYDGFRIKAGACAFTKPGYSFAGWQAGEETLKAGWDYTVHAGENTLTALWKEIADYDLIQDAAEAWQLDEGGAGSAVHSAVGGAAGTAKWTVWLNSATFGQALDFSVAGASVKVEDCRADWSGDWAVSVWLQLPPREEAPRTILAGKGWNLALNADHELVLSASGLSGTAPVKVNLEDGKWHHLLISHQGNQLLYYVGGTQLAAQTVSGAMTASGPLWMGGLADESGSLDGSMAQLRIWNSAKTPEQATRTVVDPSDNEPQPTRMDLSHGITTDRSQGFGTVGGAFQVSDVEFCKRMGFGYIRMMVYVDNLIGPEGQLQTEYIDWAVDFCNTIIDNGMPCLMSLGCGNRDKWNGTYLGGGENFEKTVRFYGELAEWIRRQGWTPEEFGLLLFTEANSAAAGGPRWTWMSDRICAAVRNVLPDMTIVTSSDGWGHISQLLRMSPMTDRNLVYSFTSYEPYTVGFNTFLAYPDPTSGWLYVKDIPYPIEEGKDYSKEIEAALSMVPESMKEGIRGVLEAYVNGTSDAGRGNDFGGLYNADWLMRRAETLDAWSRKNGGVHMAVVEFGGCDALTNQKQFNAKPGSGISEQTRLQLIRDSRIAYEAYGIGWAFWEYNEGFTVLNPEYRMAYNCVEPFMYSLFVYPDMLDALGLDWDRTLLD